MNTTQIGLLLPNSTIFPIGKDFEKGFSIGLGDAAANVTIYKEFIGSGSIKQTEDAISKLINYDDVDIITGIVSGKTTEYVAPKFGTLQKPFIVSELGEYIPKIAALNEYIFVNSHHMWQHAWTMGNWGVKTFGKKGMFIGSVYDAGYSFSHMFNVGMMDADANAEWSFSIPPNPPPGKLSDMSVIFPFLEQYQPDFVFAAFCGTEATLFLNEFIRHGWHKRTKLLGLPFLLAPFAPIEDDITIYTSLPDSSIPEMTAKESFYHLGQRAGALISEAIQTGDLYKGLLSNQRIMHLGDSHFVAQAGSTPEMITMVENKILANEKNIDQKTIATVPTFSLQDEKLGSLIGEISVGWLNPYLCI